MNLIRIGPDKDYIILREYATSTIKFVALGYEYSMVMWVQFLERKRWWHYLPRINRKVVKDSIIEFDVPWEQVQQEYRMLKEDPDIWEMHHRL